MQKDPILWSYVTLTTLSSKVDREYSFYAESIPHNLEAVNVNTNIIIGKSCGGIFPELDSNIGIRSPHFFLILLTPYHLVLSS